MKTFIYLFISVCSLSLFFSSCNDNEDIQSYFPEEYYKILYIKDSGSHEISLGNVSGEFVQTVYVCKAGSNPALEADCSIKVLSQTYVDNNYNTSNSGVKYTILPSEYYKIDNADLHFTSNETAKEINVVLNTNEIINLLNEDELVGYVLPLYAVSETDSINSGLNTYIIELKK